MNSDVSIAWGITELTLNAASDVNLAGTFNAPGGNLALLFGQNGLANGGATLTLNSPTITVGTTAFTGGPGSDTIVGPNAATTWNITGLNAGNIAGVGPFSSVENLTGGNNADQFIFGDARGLDGAIDGGAGAAVDTLNWAAYATQRNVAATAGGTTDGFKGTEASLGGGFDNIDAITAAAGTPGTLTGANLTNAWSITGANDGTLISGANTLTFTDFATLTGGTGDDTFTLAGGTLAIVNGNLGTDTLVGDNVASA